jgi:predicted Zn-dependent protease
MRFLNFFACLLLICGCVSTPITGKKAFILTSEDEEAQLGQQAYQQTLAQSRLSTNAHWNEILQRVGRRIANAAQKPDYRWEFKLIESKEKNAFCLPGGKVAVYTGIMSSFKNEAQMAAVLGHEVAHAIARHGGQRITMQLGEQAAFTALEAAMGGGQSTQKTMILQALGLGAQVGAVLPFGRAQESEADHIGLIYMAMAGYDPHEAVAFWQTFGRDSGGPPQWLSTHPSPGNREQELRRLLPEAMPYYERSPKYGAGDKI